MKNSILVSMTVTVLAVSLNSRKTEFISPTFKPTSDAAISKLPESEKLKGKEIMNWYAANLQTSHLEPQL